MKDFMRHFGEVVTERFFEEKRETEKRRQDAIDAMDWLQSRGVLMTSGLFWQAEEGGETLLEAVKRACRDEMLDGFAGKGRGRTE